MHTQEKQLTHLLYFTTDLQRKPNRRVFQNRTGGFFQNRTEFEKSIPHIPTLTLKAHVLSLFIIILGFVLPLFGFCVMLATY